LAVIIKPKRLTKTKLKKTLLIPFLTCLLLCSCKKKSIIEKELDSLEILSTNYNSIDTVFYENQKIKSLRFYKTKTEYINISFYESGKKKSIGPVKNNQCNSEYIDWYENGKQKWVRQYNLGNQIGKSINFQKNGKFEKQYDNDKKESTDYWENGNPKFKFIENKLQYYYYSNGNLIEKYDIVQKDEYYVKYFNENGKVVFSGNYKSKFLFKDNRKYNGKIICYFNNGKISHFEEVVNGIPNGKFYSYYGNGILKFESEVENGKENYYKCYYENGKVNFIRDGINKTFTSWDENGNLIK
jgi:antitoxin component YwqK of YwqJK toxin-antitoxin module